MAALKATVSGSFRKHMPAVYRVVSRLQSAGVQVMSPADCRIVDEIDGFVFLASDPWRSIKMVEDRHLQAILASDFLFIVCPDGYVGPATAFEIGNAVARSIPVYAEFPPSDPKMGCLVQLVPSVEDLVKGLLYRRDGGAPEGNIEHLLLDPAAVLERALHALEPVLRARNFKDRFRAAAVAKSVLNTAFDGMGLAQQELAEGVIPAVGHGVAGLPSGPPSSSPRMPTDNPPPGG